LGGLALKGRQRRPDTEVGPVAGPRLHFLSVVTLGFAAVFLAAVIALLLADLLYIDLGTLGEVLRSPAIRYAIRLSVITSCTTLGLVVLFAIPVGYALSRYRFPGHVIADTLVDLPIVLPPLVIGVSLLVFFRTRPSEWVEALGLQFVSPSNPVQQILASMDNLVEVLGRQFVYTVKGIVLCQFLVSASYGIRSAKAAFDSVDPHLEHLALTLGCTPTQAFRLVALPLARNGIVAGAIMSWARAVGVFGPIMVFAGAVRMKTEVMPTTIFLELSIGRIEVALAVALLMLALAALALIAIRWLASGERWWGA